MYIGIYCNEKNINDVITVFQDMFPKHKVSIKNNECAEYSFITTNHLYKIIKCDFDNPNDYNYDVCTLEEFRKKNPFVKGDIVRWHDYNEPYKILGIRGKGQVVNYEIIDEDGYVTQTLSKNLDYYDKPIKDITHKDIIMNCLRNIKSLSEYKEFKGQDFSDLTNKDIFDWIKDIADDAINYINNNVKDMI